MTSSFTSRKRIRKSFGQIESIASIPNLIEIQKNSYEFFLQINVKPENRLNKGLQEVFNSVFPIQDPSGAATLEFLKYELGEPAYRGGSYSVPLKVLLRLIVWDIDPDTNSKEIKGIKEQEVYMGEIPMMTDKGTFVVNGTERVVVSQMHRSPGAVFSHDNGITHSSGKYIYSARVIPYRGSWLDLEFDGKDVLYCRIDRKRKLYATTLLRALGLSDKDVIDTFYDKLTCKKLKDGWSHQFLVESIKGKKPSYDLIDADSGKVLVKAHTKINNKIIKQIEAYGIKNQLISDDMLVGRYIADDIINKDTGELLIKIGKELSSEDVALIRGLDIKEVNLILIDNFTIGPYIRNTLYLDRNLTQEDALIDIYRVIRPGEPPTFESSTQLFNSLFFDAERYDLSAVGRVKLNARLNLDIDEDKTVLTKEDIIELIKQLVKIKDGFGEVDDIDHLGNRRVRSVGELIENQFRIGLVRVERAILERMSAVDIDTVMPHDLVNSKMLASVIRDFFTSSQLSQFMDQTNPLSEVTHKRRLSALGPGGLTRDRASFEVRDVHQTHYGRICPIETPEGQNIGLINSLATFARINKFGFIETPYRKVIDKKVTNEIVYLSAIEEGKYIIAQSDSKLDKNGCFVDELVTCREKGEFVMARSETVDFVDVSPMQLVSVAASLIPFLENDDAHRALMGSNMQRQAVPLLKTEAPFVGTGIEEIVASDSGATVICKNTGIVEQVDATRIVIRTTREDDDSPGVEIYNLNKFTRSNHNTCINQKPIVKQGDVVSKGDIIADGPSTDLGELALGRNVLVAFMPWNGYNFEDSILISERIVKEDVFTSIHIEEFEVVARDTRLGPEEITRDIPNIGEENLRHLDEVGIVHIGAEVKAGDILVGKVTPKSESPMTPEEKLLRAIFGEKAADVRDSSLHVPPGVYGTVVDVQVSTRRGVEKDERALSIERQKIARLEKDKDDEIEIISSVIYSKIRSLLLTQIVVSGPKGIAVGSEINNDLLNDYPKRQWWSIAVENASIMEEISKLNTKFEEIQEVIKKRFKSEVDKLQSGDDLPQGALKVVKVFIAAKHKLQPGDKMAGRHGNKGVISRILPAEDMPYLEDGTPVDIVLNPLGVPSRMNIGQILETHLGWASANITKDLNASLHQYRRNMATVEQVKDSLKNAYEDDEKINKRIDALKDDELIELANNVSKGIPYATPVFDGAKADDIIRLFKKAGVDESGQVRLIDGRTGEYFDRKITVGYIYMLKLHHLVDDKIHARSIGPYSLVTQQPLGGKSHFGGQRLGEMECWALQAYGAAYTLQEMLTVKSDDVTGRVKIYESIIRGDQNFESSIPESFHVMIKELRSLCLNVELEQNK
jgi:DNA-directed RNA polymerase subunit beta